MTTNIVPDTRTEAEHRYDETRLSPAPAGRSPLFNDLKAWIDTNTAEPVEADPIAALKAEIVATADYQVKRRLIFRLFDLIFQTTQPCERSEVLCDIPIGEIDGCAVRAKYMDAEFEYGLSEAKIVWNGIEIRTDGHSYLGLPMSGGFSGEMTPAEWLAINTLAQNDICQRLMALARCYSHLSDTAQPAASVVPITVEVWGEEGRTYTDYAAGDGLSKVVIGTYSKDKPGVELIIGGSAINERLDEVITLADARQLRDNLSALLADPRLQVG